MKLSIIVPVYNMAEGGKLQYCLDSLLHQTLQDEYEIIAVDDASTDDSYKILQQYEQSSKGRIKAVLSPENRRQGGARNLGMTFATGDWIGFFDSDDWAAPDMYEKLLRKAEETGADMVGCDYHITYEHSMAIGKVVPNNTPEQTGILDEEKYRRLIIQPGSMVIKIYRHDVIKEHALLFPEHVFYEDNYAAPVWFVHFKHFEYVAEPLYYYYQHENSTVHTVNLDRLHDRMITGDMLVNKFREDGMLETYRPELEFRFTQLYYANTLFSYVQSLYNARGLHMPEMSFLKELREGMLRQFPEFQNNCYYKRHFDAEQKKLMAMHIKSPLGFIMYYTLLHVYRRIRYGKQ